MGTSSANTSSRKENPLCVISKFLQIFRFSHPWYFLKFVAAKRNSKGIWISRQKIHVISRMTKAENKLKLVKNMQSAVSYFLNELAESIIRSVPTFLLVLYIDTENYRIPKNINWVMKLNIPSITFYAMKGNILWKLIL